MTRENRQDRRLSALVDEGVRIAREEGVDAGWAFLARHRVAAHIMVRILSAPQACRGANATTAVGQAETAAEAKVSPA